jgi:tetratricopeptide (TPR) repeat protein
MAAAVIGSRIERRRRTMSLHWRRGLLPLQIAKKCQRFLRAHGIDSTVLSLATTLVQTEDNHGIFDLSIPGEQFPTTQSAFRLVCRDNEYVQGETLFNDMHNAMVRRGRVYTTLLLTTFPVDQRIRGLSDFWNIAVIPATGLRDFAAALQRLKAGEPANYTTAPAPLRGAFMEKVDRKREIWRLHDLARDEERRGNWEAAAKLWRQYLDLDPERSWAHVALVASLRQQGRLEEASAALSKAAGILPKDPFVAAESATLSQAMGDWPEAFRRWDEIIARFPDNWIGVRGKISALSKNGSFADADRLLNEMAPRYYHDTNALNDIARFAERHKEWNRAEETWRSFIKLNDKMSWAYVGLYKALLQQEKWSDAKEVLIEARERFPTNLEIAIDAAKLYERLEDWDGAAECWHSVSELRPSSYEGVLGEAGALRRQGRFAQADDILCKAIAASESHADMHEAFGLNAVAQENWTEALARFEKAHELNPSDNRFAKRIFEVRLRLADDGHDAPAPRPTSTDMRDISAEDTALVAAFESLGGTGHGCEFGIFQRHFGAEPLGLLRWADLTQDQLAAALETEFAGVGEPDFTRVFVPASSPRPEYWTTDTRYHMAMRCFVLVEDVPLDRMTRQVTKRLKFLRNKLIDDLREGSKILVYKNMKRNLTEAELRRLHAACRRYGDNTLLYIQYEDTEHPSGTVEYRSEGLLVGYIDHFSHTPDSDQYIGPATGELLRICRAAYGLFHARAAGHQTAEIVYRETAAADGQVGLSAPALHAATEPASIVFLGNCQAGTLATLYREVIARETGARVTYVESYVTAGEEAQKTVARANVLVRQVLDFAPATADLHSDGQTVLAPLVSAAFLWPCSGTKHPLNAPAPYLDEAGPYGAQIGDSFLNRLIARAVPARNAVAEYLAADIVTQRRVDAMREMILTKQRSRDEACGGYSFADFIEKRVYSEKLFRTAYHPELALTFHIAEEVFERMGVPGSLISQVRDYPGQLFPKTEAPIHPAIARHFGLTYVNPGTQYRYFDEGGYTFLEYALRYMDYVWNADLPLGIHLSRHGDTHEAIEVLQRAVAASPRSAIGHSVLSTLMAREGQLAEAVILAWRAVELAPEDQHLARVAAHYQGLLNRGSAAN